MDRPNFSSHPEAQQADAAPLQPGFATQIKFSPYLTQTKKTKANHLAVSKVADLQPAFV